MESIIPFSFSSASKPAFSILFCVGSNQCQSCGGQEKAKQRPNIMVSVWVPDYICLEHTWSQVWVVK